MFYCIRSVRRATRTKEPFTPLDLFLTPLSRPTSFLRPTVSCKENNYLNYKQPFEDKSDKWKINGNLRMFGEGIPLNVCLWPEKWKLLVTVDGTGLDGWQDLTGWTGEASPVALVGLATRTGLTGRTIWGVIDPASIDRAMGSRTSSIFLTLSKYWEIL